MRQNLVAQFIQVLKHGLWDMQSGLVVEKNLALSVGHCQLQALQFYIMNFKSLYLSSKISLLIKIGTITTNTVLPTRNSIKSCSIKIRFLGISEILESIFCLLLGVEVFSPQKVVEMLEEVVTGWQEVR